MILMKKIGNFFENLMDIIFYIVYIVLLIISILDLFDISIPFIECYTNDVNKLLKFLLLVFASVGIIILNDKRTLMKKVVDPISKIGEVVKQGAISKTNLFYFKNKKDDYDFFAREIRNLQDGAEVLVTSFDKNQSTNYYTGEDKHTEALMDDYTSMIQSGNIRVKQMVHVCTKKEYGEVLERIKLYENCNNYSLSAMVGLPIRPYIDFAIINKETVMLCFPNDKTAPYNEAFSIAIKDKEIAIQFEKFFDIYWNNDCRVIKGNDGINKSNLAWLEELSLDNIVDLPEYIEYKALLLKLIISLKEFSDLREIIFNTHKLTYQNLFLQQRERIKVEMKNFYTQICNKIIKESITMSWSETRTFLLHSLIYVQKRLLSVTIIQQNSYWANTNRLEEFVKGLISTEIKIEKIHIFVISSSDLAKYKKRLKAENRSGVKVYVIVDDDIQENEYKNYIVLDDILAIDIEDNDITYSIVEEEKIKIYVSDFSTKMTKATTNF